MAGGDKSTLSHDFLEFAIRPVSVRSEGVGLRRCSSASCTSAVGPVRPLHPRPKPSAPSPADRTNTFARTHDPPKNLYYADIVRASVDRPGMKERYLTKLGVRLMGRKVDSQRGENLNSLFIAACQQVDQVFLVGLA